MPEDNLGKFKQIISKLPDDKRKLLYERLHDLPQEEREPFIADFVKKYDDRNKKQEPKKVSPSSKPVQTGKKPAPHNGASHKPAQADKNAPQGKNAHPAKTSAPVKGSAQGKKPVPQKGQAPAGKAPSAKVPAGKATAGKNPTGKTPAGKVPANNAPQAKKPVPVKEAPKKEAPPKIEVSHVTEPEDEEKKPAKKNASASIIVGILTALFVVGALYMVYIFNKDKIDGKFNQMFGMPGEETLDTEPDEGIIGPEPSNSYPTSTPIPTPTPSPVPIPDDHPDLRGLVIVIDPGHQAEADTELEEVFPGSSAEKERASQGAVGVSSRVKE